MAWVTRQFYVDLCDALGLPVTQNRIDTFTWWQYAEGPKRGEGGARHNPFNVTEKMPGSTDFNDNGGFPVQNYVSRAQGVAATAMILKQSNYRRILTALKNNAQPYYVAVEIARAGAWTNGWLMCEVLHDHGVGANG